MKEDEDVFEGKMVSKVIQYQVLITFKLPKTNSFFFFFSLSLMDSVGEGEGGKIWENGIETCKISCMK